MIDDFRDAVGAMRDSVGRRRTRRRLQARFEGIQIHPSAEIRSPDRLTLGAHVVVDRGVLLHCGGMAWSDFEGSIAIAAKSYIGPNSVLFGAGGIEIGEVVLISPGVVITSQQHGQARGTDMRDQPVVRERIVIERDVWVGANATILPGVRLGCGSVVGAGAVVREDVPAMTVVVGVPARAVRER